MNRGVWGLLPASAAISLLTVGAAHAVEPVDNSLDEFDKPIAEESEVRVTDCQRAARWKKLLGDGKLRESFAVCYGGPGGSAPRVDSLRQAVDGYLQAAKDDFAATGTIERAPGECQPASDAESAARASQELAAAEKQAQKAQALAEAKRQAASDAHAAATKAATEADAVNRELADARRAGLVARAKVLEVEAKKKGDEAAARLQAYTAAQAAEVAATAEAAAAQATLAQKRELAATRGAAAAKAAKARFESSKGLRTAIDQLFATAKRSPDDFERRVENERWRNACRESADALYGISAKTPEGRALESSEDAARESAHASDVLRKSSMLAGALSNSNSFLEKPGAPDKTIFSVMSALGADRTSNGTQVVMTLNLASLMMDEAQRLQASPLVRNLFLRAALPLDSTQQASSTTGVSAEGSKAASTSTSRFSVVLGGSFEDETDPRLPSNSACHRAVLSYLPFQESDVNDARLAEERKLYYDVCNRIAAQRQRLSWRGGLGFLTERSDAPDDAAKTRAELAAGALVYAPSSWAYFNLVYQHLFLPDVVNTIGGGASFARNVGGPRSGVDAWTRVGIDTLFLASKAQIDGEWQWQWRIAPTVHARLSDNTITSIGFGPRVMGGNKDVAWLATVALSYDADTVLQPVLTPIVPAR